MGRGRCRELRPPTAKELRRACRRAGATAVLRRSTLPCLLVHPTVLIEAAFGEPVLIAFSKVAKFWLRAFAESPLALIDSNMIVPEGRIRRGER